ncbi:Cytochrome c-type biogenesis protein CcsA/ResC [Dissulfuribacter thermophilus]|uniref:Heme exporter protein C n=1 Tax=Dissulfuribacter thermophilus TaxID=1156395 RepID=A0A1B9F699_9BACT|nr:c-type cytochrome biogenesis protein CcsB [Dissulfuribacter thermophilus]OCC15442.1 Cytochrome c-type biogenesis protein CcsA/ResC [Dissulfuribacter thermophilus]
MDRFFFVLAFLVYGVSFGGFFVHMITLKKPVKRAALWVLFCGFILHGLSIGARWYESGHPPVVNFHETLSFVAFFMTGLYLALEQKYRLKTIGTFVTPIILLIMAAAAVQPQRVVPLPPALQSIWLPIHATICLISYAVFALSFCISVMFLIQERQIKKKHLGGLFKRLPSLDALDVMNERCLKVGFPLLTIGIVTGSIWAEEAWGRYWGWDPKETWSLITWLWYAAILHQRLTVGWRGRRAAIMTIIGFLTLIFTFIGVNFLLSGEHSYVSRF